MRDPDILLRKAGIRGDPDRDQHFLIDDRVLDRIPTYLPEDTDTSVVLEIGAGTGALTDRLLGIGDRVIAIEQDSTLVRFLEAEFGDEISAHRLEVLEGDALTVPIPEFTTVVANLPYGVSSEIAFRLLPERKPMVLMFQREFAERMVATPGESDYGRLSVTTAHYATAEIVEIVPKEAFSPKPAVQSAIVRFAPCEPTYSLHNEAIFFDFVRAVFTQRRKTMRNAIRNTTHISGIDDASSMIEKADETLLQKRPGELSPEAFAELSNLIVEIGMDI